MPQAFKGYRTMMVNTGIAVVAMICFAIDLLDQGTASSLVLASITNLTLRADTTTPVGEP